MTHDMHMHHVPNVTKYEVGQLYEFRVPCDDKYKVGDTVLFPGVAGQLEYVDNEGSYANLTFRVTQV